MDDAEILRLRKLRNVALRARALGKFLDLDSAAQDSLFTECAVLCWTIARIATGRLRAHPYLSYQRGHGPLARLADDVIAAAVGRTARRQKRWFSVYALQIQSVVDEVDDVRALTWSPDLSDALGRMQTQLRRLTNELDRHVATEMGASIKPCVTAAVNAEANSPLAEIAADNGWPYLAI